MTTCQAKCFLLAALLTLFVTPSYAEQSASPWDCALIEVGVVGIVHGPIFDMCGQFIVEAPVGERSALINVFDSSCPSVGSWSYWLSLVGSGVRLYGVENWRDQCGFSGAGDCVFCPWTVVATTTSSWGMMKARYR